MKALETVTAKIPTTLRDEAETVASRRWMTVSTLIRRGLEREVTEAATGDRIGPVEASAREEIGAYGDNV
jgi:hypothetical protein